MKHLLFILIVLLFLTGISAEAQTPPVWTHDINSSPDTASLFPVRTLNDDSNHVYVLSTYMKTVSVGNDEYKIYLKKYDQAGALIWTLIYDHAGTGKPQGFDMVMDHDGNCYIAGGLMATTYSKPLIIKVNTAGGVSWERDSTTAFNSGNYDQVFFNHNRLYLKSSYGIAKFDLSGSERWSLGLPVGRMAVDNEGQSIVSVYFGNPTNILRYDSSGVLNFSDTTIDAMRIATDADNNFYLMSHNYPVYNLTKYDSAGNFEWNRDVFSQASPFGDIGFEVLTDFNKDVILVGLGDSIYKWSPSGNLIWAKSMHRLDSYLISAKIVFNNLIAVAGTSYDSVGYFLKVSTFDLNGDENWSGVYNGNTGGSEFEVDFTVDNSGIYTIENNNQNTTLAKFASPFQSAIDYNLLCVDSVWYDPANPAFVNVRVFNGNVSHLNYPSVRGVSANGDTTINPHNFVDYFAHLGNIYLTYHDSITVTGVTDFSHYTFLMSEGFGDTTAVIGWCAGAPQEIISITGSEIKIYPNPVHDALIIESAGYENKNSVIQIFNALGSMVLEEKLSADAMNRINVSGFADGIYFGRIMAGGQERHFKFVKE